MTLDEMKAKATEIKTKIDAKRAEIHERIAKARELNQLNHTENHAIAGLTTDLKALLFDIGMQEKREAEERARLIEEQRAKAQAKAKAEAEAKAKEDGKTE